MILDLILNPESSLLYEPNALEEVEKFLLSAKKKLSGNQLKKLKDFINNDLKTDLEQKEHFLGLIENKIQPHGHKYFKIEKGWVEPLIEVRQFENLTNDDIVNYLNEGSRADPLKQISLNWDLFVPLYPARVWKILQYEEFISNNEFWESTARALVKASYRSFDKETYNNQWETLTSENGFIDTYIKKKLNPTTIIDWLNRVASSIGLPDDKYLDYWSKLWALSEKLPISQIKIFTAGEEVQPNYLLTAINDPRGKLSEGLLNALYRNKLEENSGIPTLFLEKFDMIFRIDSEEIWLAQLIFAQHFRNLAYFDLKWTESKLLAAFEHKKNPNRAARMWTGFLYNPNLDFRSFELIKPFLLELINEWNDLFSGKIQDLKILKKNLIHLIVFYKIVFPETISHEEFKSFFQNKNIDVDDLSGLFILFKDLLKDSVENGQDLLFWEKTLQPFFKSFWPGEKRSAQISLHFLELAAFCPNAVVSIRDFLIEKPFLITIDFSNERFIYFTYDLQDGKKSSFIKSLKNAKAFFDLLYKVSEGLKELDMSNNSDFPYLKSLSDFFVSTFPELAQHDSFKKVKRSFQI